MDVNEPAFKLVITWTPGGQINLTGNAVNDKGASYAMLELAKDVIRDHFAKNQSPIVRAAGAVPRMGNG